MSTIHGVPKRSLHTPNIGEKEQSEKNVGSSGISISPSSARSLRFPGRPVTVRSGGERSWGVPTTTPPLARTGPAGPSGSSEARLTQDPAGRRTGRRGVLGLVAGLALTAGLPPFGWWPLALVGAGLLALALDGCRVRARLTVAVATGLGFVGPGLFWMSEFSAPGYALAVIIEVALLTLTLALVPTGTGRRSQELGPGLVLGLPAALVLAEALRGIWPFGGVPIATVAQTQIGGPLAEVARAGGGLAVTATVAVAGVGLALAVRRRQGPALVAAAIVALTALGGALAPDGRDLGELEVAVVQGGGQRGLLATDDGDEQVLATHVAATADVPIGLDLVLWPENVVTVKGAMEERPEARTVTEVADSLGATLVAGVVERRGDRFRNAAVAWGPDGVMGDRYDKNQRVPFGEYVPFRGLVERVADISAIPRDALPGDGPGLLRTEAGDLGVVISYEVFFPRRARDAMVNGAGVLLVPTNASSFTTSQMPTIELGAARMRAIETGRWVLQAAPTGLSAVIAPDGTVMAQSDLGRRQVLLATIQVRDGATPYTRLGDGPFVVVAAVALVAAWAVDARRRRRHLHVGPT